MKLCFALILTLAAFSALTFAQTRPPLTPEVRKKTFEKAWKMVNKNFYDKNFNGVDWKAVKKQYAPLIEAAASDAEFYDLMKRMMRELKVSHMDLITPPDTARLRERPAVTGIALRRLDGKLVFTRIVKNSPADVAGLKPGYALSKIDGEAVASIADAQKRLNGPAGSTLKISYLDAGDQLRDIELTRRAITDDNRSRLGSLVLYGVFESKRLPENIGYIYFSNFLPFMADRFKAAVESMMATDGMIIDLRGNSGGDDLVGVKIAGLFFEKSTQLMFSRTRHGQDQFEYFARAVKNPYQGKLVILVDDQSRSASEQFAAGMQESGRAVVVGLPTPGEDLDGDLEALPDGSLLLYAVGEPRTPKGRVIEGNGVIPNIDVRLTRGDLLAGLDTQLEAARAYIRSKK